MAESTERHSRRRSPMRTAAARIVAATALTAAHLLPHRAFALSLWGRDSSTAGDADSAAASAATATADDGTRIEYGVDVSFPMHHRSVESKNTNPLGDRQKFYDDFMRGCRDRYQGRLNACDQTEKERVAMSLRQPQSMQNYTDVGFKKIRAPDKVYKLLKEFWDTNHQSQNPEAWPKGNTYTNHWASPTYMVSVEDYGLRGAGGNLKQAIWDAARDTIQEWTGQELTQCSLYGIRVYKDGAVLATHVDRLPLVSSAIINVAQDVDEPWPIEVYGHDGKATNVTMEPGDMVLYESHSVLHGRPFPLKGRFYANVFIHFEPTGHSLRHNAREEGAGDDVREKYRRAAKKGQGGHEADHDNMPSYIKEGSIEAAKWRREHPSPGAKASRPKSFATGSTATAAHHAAQAGDAKGLSRILETKGDHLVHAQDENGWTPLHEGSRGGHKDVVELLVKKGANVNERTNGGVGGTALWFALSEHGERHPVVQYLKSVGGVSVEPEL